MTETRAECGVRTEEGRARKEREEENLLLSRYG